MTFNLQGVVYLGGEHFVSRIINANGVIWFHDGITTHSSCICKGHIDQLPDDECLWTLARGGVKTATIAVYTQY